jgi:eukaryotic-like serine/threonine-protein kinase
MKLKLFFQSNTLGSLLTTLGATIGIILLLGVAYFYIYLPNATNHGEEVVVPDITGMTIAEISAVLEPLNLRYEADDSSYTAKQPPLTVIQQFPKAGHHVKENRIIYVSINSTSPPTLPLPNLIENGGGSLANAKAVLRSNELIPGKTFYQHSPFRDLVIEMRIRGKVIAPGSRVPKGSVVDLVVGDGGGPKDFILGNFVGMSYENAILRLNNLSLHLGKVEIPEDADTTDIVSFVLKQFPMAGDSVSIGDPINLIIGPKGHPLPDDPDEEN